MYHHLLDALKAVLKERRTIHKKDPHDPDNQKGVITYLEPDILKRELKWALGSITMNKASGGDGILVKLFHILRQCCESAALNMPANLENSAVTTGLEEVGFHSNLKERQCQRMLKLLHNCTHLTLLQSNTQNSPRQASTVQESELPDVQAGFRKGRGTRDQIANIC